MENTKAEKCRQNVLHILAYVLVVINIKE